MLDTQRPRRRGRQPREFPRALIAAAAKRYFIDGQKQEAIAIDLGRGLSVRDVSRLLRLAEEQKIVRHLVDPVLETNRTDAIKAKYPRLNEVFVVEDGPGPERDRRWGIAAANYFEKLWAAHTPGTPFRVGLTGGQTFLEMVTAVPQMDRPDLSVHVPALVGHGSMKAQHIDAISIASMLWARSGRFPGRLDYATVSPYAVSTPGLRARRKVQAELARLAAYPAIEAVLTGLEDLDVVFSRINQINPEGSADEHGKRAVENYLRPIATMKELRAEGAVGAFAYSLFDKNGEQDKKWQFFLTAGHGTDDWGVAFHKEMVRKHKVVVAAGDYVPAVRAALKGEIFNVLITDESTAAALLT